MDNERIEAMLSSPTEAGQSDELADGQQRTPVTILFSDIKGSTSYFEKKGDVEGLAMLERHNELLVPCIEANNGRLVKTIGDALMTLFTDPVDAVRSAVEMQNVLLEDGKARDESERIRIPTGCGRCPRRHDPANVRTRPIQRCSAGSNPRHSLRNRYVRRLRG